MSTYQIKLNLSKKMKAAMEKEIMKQINKTNEELYLVISSFTIKEFNIVPFEGSWTPAQVADHIIKFQSGIPQLIKGKVGQTVREPGEKIQQLKDIFLDFTIKIKSPEFVKPTNLPLEKEKVLKELASVARAIDEEMPGLDLSLTCLEFDLPGTGPMTRLEWLHFILFHTQRHIHQLKNINEIIAEDK